MFRTSNTQKVFPLWRYKHKLRRLTVAVSLWFGKRYTPLQMQVDTGAVVSLIARVLKSVFGLGKTSCIGATWHLVAHLHGGKYQCRWEDLTR